MRKLVPIAAVLLLFLCSCREKEIGMDPAMLQSSTVSLQVIARMAGLSDKFIAITVLAAGTSLPELATSLVAALKGRAQLALGNILGSNVFNILLILGSSALITPLSFASITNVDALVLLLSMLLLLIWAYTGRRERIDRLEGAIMLLLFGAYYTYLFIRL